ncbi:unnamed protein product [Zymoseptoria tritici ST99CH_1A5]|uniref:Carboxypeptidase n=1 Tax=Zymoseptoria tritici ST99CH_1A5 TaxID=1276529 RepID=A0A1Y6LY12_ZYMTR|nr:unnamed protein product [Zymoseptoria tritici ST99CH_1A5]
MARFYPPSSRRRRAWPSLLTVFSLFTTTWLSLADAAATKSAADYYVHDLPGAPPEPRLDMFAGHIEVVPEHHGHLFFWLFKNRHIANRQRTVIWFNGGPGCSSMDGALMENGPYRVNENGTLRFTDGGWDEFANVVYVDQPVGTGFSYIDTDSYVHEMPAVKKEMITFLTRFFEIFPEMEHDDIYLAGESYAGQWIPNIAQAIVERNKANSARPWNLAGLMIGNGWISGPEQYISYIPFAYEVGLIRSGDEVDKLAREQEKTCLAELQKDKDNKLIDIHACEQIMQTIMANTRHDGDCVNMYDTRLRDSFPSCGMNWPPDLAYVKPYLRRDDVLSALHIDRDKNTGWVECNDGVGRAFTARNSEPSVHLLPELLEHMRIVLFSGDKDMICNHIGTENVINNLKWNGAVGMEISTGMTAPKQEWTFEGDAAGSYQTARNLTYLRFYNASHMVPFDYPRRTRDMLDRFMGVDIASIGGKPTDSRIDGAKNIEVSVGGHPNSTAAQEKEADRLQQASWAAYRRSGEVALVIVLIAAACWSYVIVRERRKRKGYTGVLGLEPFDEHGRSMSDGLGLNGSARKARRDVEAARAYDEAELDDLSPAGRKERGADDGDEFGLADSEDEDEDDRRARGRANGRS